MQEQLISFETAKLAKDKGFNEPCFNFYEDDVLTDGSQYSIKSVRNSGFLEGYKWVRQSAPTQALLKKWLRETHKMYVQAFPLNTGKWEPIIYFLDQPLDGTDGMSLHTESNKLDSEEEAIERGLQEALNMIK